MPWSPDARPPHVPWQCAHGPAARTAPPRTFQGLPVWLSEHASPQGPSSPFPSCPGMSVLLVTHFYFPLPRPLSNTLLTSGWRKTSNNSPFLSERSQIPLVASKDPQGLSPRCSLLLISRDCLSRLPSPRMPSLTSSGPRHPGRPYFLARWPAAPLHAVIITSFSYERETGGRGSCLTHRWSASTGHAPGPAHIR